MDRRRWLVLAGGLATTLARAQAPPQGTRPKRVGLLVVGGQAERAHLERDLLEGLKAEGFVEGRNLVLERRYAEGDQSRARPYAQELAGLQLDAVVTTCTPSTRLMREEASGRTPIVMAVVSDPVGQGLIASLARPGGNITGVSSQFEDILPKMIESFASVLASGTQVAVLANPANAVHPRLWLLTQGAAQKLHLRAVRVPIARRIDVAEALARAVQEGAQAIFPLPDDPLFFNSRTEIVAAAGRHRLPGLYFAREFVEAGGLMSYGEDIGGGYQRAARYVGRVLRGAKPAELPVEQPTRFELVLNLKAAQALGVAIPPSLRLSADRVIQ